MYISNEGICDILILKDKDTRWCKIVFNSKVLRIMATCKLRYENSSYSFPSSKRRHVIIIIIIGNIWYGTTNPKLIINTQF